LRFEQDIADFFTTESLALQGGDGEREKFINMYPLMYNILITPSPERDRGNGPKTRPRIEPPKGDVIPNLSALAGTFALQGGEEVSSVSNYLGSEFFSFLW
jgi:hypothetical protein